MFVVLLVIDPTSHELGSPANSGRFSSAEAYPDLASFRTNLRENGFPYVDTIQAALKAHGKPWHDKPAFAGTPKLAVARPDFYSAYPSFGA